jgi:ribosomal protein S12 methylthiotransferase accessory factor
MADAAAPFQRPRFSPRLRIDVLPPDLLVASGDSIQRVLQGRLLPLLAPLLDGRRTVAALTAELAGRAHALDVHFGLSLLHGEGLLCEGGAQPAASTPTAELPAPERWWAERGLDAAAVRAALGASPITVESVPGEAEVAGDRAALEHRLHALGARIEPAAARRVVAVSEYLDPALDDFDRRARRHGWSWLPVRAVGEVVWAGPWMAPAGAGCWRCLAHRVRAHRLDRHSALAGAVPLQAARALSSAAGVELAARLAVELTVGPEVRLPVPGIAVEPERPAANAPGPSLLTASLAAPAVERHAVRARPACPRCGEQRAEGDRSHSGWRAPRLRATPRIAAADGGWRAAPASETLRRLTPLVSDRTGLVASLRPHVLEPMQVYVAEHLFRADAEPRAALAAGLYRKSAGKGMSAEQARVSALCEALERWSGVFRGDEPRLSARREELGDAALHPNDCMLYSDRQFAERARWNRAGERYLWVPEPFRDEQPVEWSPLWSLRDERGRLLPTAFCYYAYPLPTGDRFCQADSNGTAAGGCLEEAILQGFFELVERDAIALWWYHRLRRPAVDLASFGEPFLDQIARFHRRLDFRVRVLDITSDLAIPAFVATARAPDGERLLGFGCHLDAGIAVARAVTELNQFLPGSLAGRRRRLFSEPLGDDAFLDPAPELAPLTAADYPRSEIADLAEAVRFCVARAAEHGLDTLVLDQSRQDAGVRVVKVVVPGLRHFWARLAPGRLYEVPRRLGWIADATSGTAAENGLNPVHLLI